MATKPAATREEVHTLDWGAIEAGRPEAAAAAVIYFEWPQRPENVLASYVTWSSYAVRSTRKPSRSCTTRPARWCGIPLRKRRTMGTVRFYEEAEAVLARTPRHGVPIVLKPARGKKPAEAYTAPLMWKVISELRDDLDPPSTFTLDACRHGGMTELEEAELTDGQGRALSGHRSKAYEGYAKRTMKRAATRKRHAHKLAANASGTEIQNERRAAVQNDGGDDDAALA